VSSADGEYYFFCVFMGRLCEEPHCLQTVPDELFQSHQDEHVAERLAAEEHERNRSRQFADAQFAQELASQGTQNGFSELDQQEIEQDPDYQLALSLNRQFREEEEQRSYQSLQVLISIAISHSV
jgi:hypothetical protein